MLLICLLAASSVFGQQLSQLSGKVVDGLGDPLPGVAVVVKGGTKHAITNEQGVYTLSEVSADATLVFTYLGMKNQEVKVGNRSAIDVVLESESFALGEVVAIGYGVAKKKDITGAIATLDGEVASKRNTTQLAQALQGTLPGVMITRSNSEPGASATVRVRGVTTIGDSDPLVIVDGVPVSSMNDVNAADIDRKSVV